MLTVNSTKMFLKIKKKTNFSLLNQVQKTGILKKKKPNPSNYFISKATFQTIFVSNNLSPSAFSNGKIESFGLELLETKIV